MNTPRYLLVLASIIFLLSSFLACSEKKKEKSSTPKTTVKTYYIQGNPMAVLDGATLSKKVPFTVDDLLKFKNIHLLYRLSYVEKVKKIPASVPSEKGRALKRSNNPNQTKKAINNKDSRYIFKKYTDSEGDYYFLEKPNRDEGSKLLFEVNESGQLFLPDRFGKDFRSLHFSISDDQKLFSILYWSHNNGVRSILNYVFSLEEPSPKEDLYDPLLKQFNYMWGAGFKLRWEQPQKIYLCDKDDDNEYLLRKIQYSIDSWNKAIGNNMLIFGGQINDYPPFSNLNTNCIYLIDFFGEYRSGAETVFVRNLNQSRIINSQILLWDGNFRHHGQSYRDKPSDPMTDRDVYFQSAILHEMGHFLGLHHQFDYDDPNKRSVMGYRTKYLSPQQHDIDAIQALYQ